MVTKYLDPKNDLAFKKIFGTEKHKRIPMAFLNAVLNLEGEDRILDLEFLNPARVPDAEARKQSIVDVLVKDQKGSRYIVEMQVAHVAGFEKRAQYYAAKTYCSDLKRGEKYHDLVKVIFLAITDYIVFLQKESYKSDHYILDNKTFENDLKDFSFTFIELPKFNKSLDELVTVEDKWCYFLKHADESANIAEVLASLPEIKEAYQVLDRFSWSEEEMATYEQVFKNITDWEATLDAAIHRGKVEGLQQGLAKGEAKGKAEGLQQGKAEGEKAKALEVAKALIEKGLSTEDISDITGLNVSDIVVSSRP